ncbi:MAG TPA: DUF177 domain-containing protein [Macromonas sp.]|nr:DUF177 domain-containing protein [Macromonas sp.]
MTASTPTTAPTSIDLRALAKQGDALNGHTPLAAFKRLSLDLPPLAEAGLPADVALQWQAQAEWRAPLLGSLSTELKSGVAGQPQLWLHLVVQGSVPQICQRCLTAYPEPLDVDRWFRFVTDETTALAEDDDSEEDVLVLEPRFNLHELIEDELLMALPLVPMHEECPQPLRMSAGEADLVVEEERPHPFAALAALKGGKKSGHKPT